MIASGGSGLKVVRETHSENSDFCDTRHRPSMYDDLAVMLGRRAADDSGSEGDEALAVGTVANT